MRQAKQLIALYLIVLLGACSTFGLATPQTFNQKLAYAYGTNTSVRLVAKDLLTSGSITVEDAKNIQTKADEARSILDAARTANISGDTSTAQARLLTAQQILAVLDSFLKSKGGNL